MGKYHHVMPDERADDNDILQDAGEGFEESIRRTGNVFSDHRYRGLFCTHLPGSASQKVTLFFEFGDEWRERFTRDLFLGVSDGLCRDIVPPTS